MAGNRAIFEQAMNRGASAAWDQQWDKAIAYYRAALTEFPDDASALNALGFALFQLDRLNDALAIYQRAATLSPGDPVAPEKCGEIFERQGRLNEAAQTYLAVAEMHIARRDVPKAVDNLMRVVHITPDNLNARSRLALALERTHRTHEAALEYLEVARLFQRARAVDKAGQAVVRALQLEPQSPEAKDAAEKLQRGKPIQPMSRAGTGPLGQRSSMLTRDELSALDQAAPAEVVGTAELVGLQTGGSPLVAAKEDVLGKLAEMLFEEDTDTSKLVSSVNALTRTGGGGRDAQSQRAQAIMYLGQALNNQSSGSLDVALNNYASVLENGLEHPLVYFMLGALSLELRRPEAAVKYLEPAAARDDIALGALYGLGEAHRQLGQTRKAFGYLLGALKRLDMQLVTADKHDALAEAYESLAESYGRASDTEIAKAVPALTRFLSGEGWEERARQARQQLDEGAEDGQVTSLGDMLATPGTDRVLDSMRKIEEMMRRKLYASAMEEAYYALQFSPTYLPVHIRMAEILVAEDRPEVATTKYKVIARTYHIRGEVGRAARLMQQVLKLNPMDMEARGKLIALLTEQGKAEDALVQYVDLADTHYQLADLEGARATYTEALQFAKTSGAREWIPRILHKLADIDIQRLAWREALRLYEQIKTLAPNDDKARIALIDLYFRLANTKQAIAELDLYLKQLISARALTNATALVEELLHNYPQEPALLARLARLYQDQGRKADAIATYDHLGDIQLQAGQNDQARETIRTILQLGPDDPAQYQRLLAQL
jgi:tetratricopeptide (TPR) repeat protein